jgi:predicted DNA-binding protein YlxM (UPF0122 family)
MDYTKDRVFDVSLFRKENPKVYATIPYYFGTIDSVLDELGVVKTQKQAKNKVTLRNRLAYDHLQQLRKDYTMEQIAQMYNVSRALINQQIQALELLIGIEKVEKQLEE